MNSDKPALPVTNKLRYEYDYGDDWQVKIEVVDEYIMDEDNNDLPELMWQIYEKGAPVCVAADGLPVLDDVGGVSGYCDFLKGINKQENDGPYDDPAESRAWARSLGWTGRLSKAENML